MKFEILPKKMYTLIMKKGGGKMKLDLDFSLGSSDDRAQFVSKYLKSVDPTTLTGTNLELIGTYILWGKAWFKPLIYASYLIALFISCILLFASCPGNI